jgi:hypothetical protein
VFATWNLPVVQPYAVAVDEYLMLRNDFLRSEDRKQPLSRAIFEDLVPEYVFSRAKVRAQVGNPSTEGDVLAACVDRSFDETTGCGGVLPGSTAWTTRPYCTSLSGLGATPLYRPLNEEGTDLQ